MNKIIPVRCKLSGSESVSTLEDASRFDVVLLFPLRFPN